MQNLINKSIPEIQFLIRRRITQLVSKNGKSYPYLSGDFFSQIADYAVPSNLEEINIVELLKARVLFIPSHFVDYILSSFKHQLKCEILIAGNSDFEFRKTDLELPRSVKKAFLQNSFISDDKTIFTLPIGIENLKLARNGFKSTMKKVSWLDKMDRILIGPFSPTSSERSEVLEFFLQEKGPWDVMEVHLPPYEYPKLQSKYKFVLCPGGNGIDTHRVWETIYRGSLPIVLDNSWSRSLVKKFPLVLAGNLLGAQEMQDILAQEKSRNSMDIPNVAFADYWLNLFGKETA